MRTQSEFDRREFLQQSTVVFTALYWTQPNADSSQEEHGVSLATWPHNLYKENDGVLQPAVTESFAFNLRLDFRADGLPARFENISFDLLGKPMKIASPKRGILMEAH